MLEWLKDILGDGYTEEIDKQVSDEIGKAYAPRADLDSANEAKAAAEAQLADANKTIAGYKDMDIDAIRQSAADWQAKAEQAQKDADARVAAVQFDARLDGAIGKRRGRSPKAIKALLDMDALRGSKNQDQDIDAALDALQKDSGYLFEPVETPPPMRLQKLCIISPGAAVVSKAQALGLPVQDAAAKLIGPASDGDAMTLWMQAQAEGSPYFASYTEA